MNAEQDSRVITGIIRAYGGSAYKMTTISTPQVKSPGLYVLYFVTASAQGFCIPLYCGFTSRSLEVRLKEHAQPGGQIYTMRTPGGVKTSPDFPIATANGEVYIGFLESTGMLAKLMESSLLLNYDFLLNASENGQRRLLDVTQAQESDWAALDDTHTARQQIDHWNPAVENIVNEAIVDAKQLSLSLEKFRGFV
ncbi:hypothetical protein [Pseudomonas kulmbachensis]|uniref:hypothetical protein n=1 Tax=Pseudomonas kulmbachensis TaxID=3043408 RepID=UPI002AB2AEBB|nr:hypothetical protein [Pseudomonas sp. V3/3/4/13]